MGKPVAMGRGGAKGRFHAKDSSAAAVSPKAAEIPAEPQVQPEMRVQPISLANLPTPSRRPRHPRPERAREQEDDDSNRAHATPSALEEIMRHSGLDAAWDALEAMQQAGTRTDKFSVSRLLMKTVGEGSRHYHDRWHSSRVYRSITIIEKFIAQQPEDVDEVLFNALLDTCGRLKDLPRLESLAARMRELKVKPSPVTLGILVKTYGQAGDIQKVLDVWSDMKTQRAEANAVTYGCMLDACVKCGQLAKAVEIFNEMRPTGKHKNTVLFTTLIKGFGLERDFASALELFREMPRVGVPYNTITYNSIIDAAVKCQYVQMAESLLREMLAPSNSNCCEPDLITFSTVLKGYCNAGDIDKALQAAETIKARGLRCDELVYNTLMDGCVKMNDVAAGVGLFEEMVQSGMKPSTITHSILTRLYARAGPEEDAAYAVAELYAHHGLEPPALGDRSGGRSGSNRNNKWQHQQPQSPAGNKGARKRSGATPKGSHPWWKEERFSEDWSNNWSGEAHYGQVDYGGISRQLDFGDQCYSGVWDQSEPCTPFSLSACLTPCDSSGYCNNPFGLSPLPVCNASGGQVPQTNGGETPFARAMTVAEGMADGSKCGYSVVSYGSPFGTSPIQRPNFDNNVGGGMMPFNSPASMQQVIMPPARMSPTPQAALEQQQQQIALHSLIQPTPQQFQGMPQQPMQQAVPQSMQQMTATLPNGGMVQVMPAPQGMNLPIPSQPMLGAAMAPETSTGPARPSLEQSPCLASVPNGSAPAGSTNINSEAYFDGWK